MLTVVYLVKLPHHTESSYVSTLFDRDTLNQITGIYTYPGGSSSAWVLFKSLENARFATRKYHNAQFGPAGLKLFTSLTTGDGISAGASNLMTIFNHNLENQIESCTLEMTNLPENHTGRNLNQLLESISDKFDMHVADPHPYCSNYGLDKMVHSGVREPKVPLVQLAAPVMARSIVHRFADTHWKNATLNGCAPDAHMEMLLDG